MTAPATEAVTTSDPSADHAVTSGKGRPLALRRRVAVPVAVVLALIATTLLTLGRVEGVRGSEVGLSNVHPGDVVSVGQLLVRNQGPGRATILAVRARGTANDLAGLEIGPALVGSPGVGVERGFPPKGANGPLTAAEGAVLPPRADEQAVSDLVLKITVTDSRVHRIDGVEVTYWQYGRIHRVRTGPDIVLCPGECPAP